jgi:hypothetical protein
MARIESAVTSGGGVGYDGRAAKIAGKEPDSPAPTTPWEPEGQRAHKVRGMLNSYTRGRRAALEELGR